MHNTGAGGFSKLQPRRGALCHVQVTRRAIYLRPVFFPSFFVHSFAHLFLLTFRLMSVPSAAVISAVISRDIGPLLIATWANSFLVMLEWTQAFKYYKTYPDDAFSSKIVVAVVLVIDFACSVFEMHDIYTYCITYWGDVVYVFSDELTWPVSAATFATSLTTAVVQGYLIWRVSRLIRSHAERYFIGAYLSFCVAGSLGGAIWVSMKIAVTHTNDNQNALHISAIVAVAVGAATDVQIAIVYIWKLLALKKKHAVEGVQMGRSAGIIRQLIKGAIKTGTAAATLEVLALILFFAISSNASAAVVFLVGRVSTLTLLMNLNSREELAHIHSNTPVSQTGPSKRSPWSSNFLSAPRTTVDGIHVTSGTQIHLDDVRTQGIRMVPLFEEAGRYSKENEKSLAYTASR